MSRYLPLPSVGDRLSRYRANGSWTVTAIDSDQMYVWLSYMDTDIQRWDWATEGHQFSVISSSPTYVSCPHEYVNVSLQFIKMVCKYCDREQ